MTVLLLLFLWFPEDNMVLVLKNGRIIHLAEAYRIEGQTVRFKDHKGSLMMLPLKLVDLDATSKYVPKVVKKPASSGPTAASDLDALAASAKPNSNIELKDKDLQSYSQEKPRSNQGIQGDKAPSQHQVRLPPKAKGPQGRASKDAVIRTRLKQQLAALNLEERKVQEQIRTLIRPNVKSRGRYSQVHKGVSKNKDTVKLERQLDQIHEKKQRLHKEAKSLGISL